MFECACVSMFLYVSVCACLSVCMSLYVYVYMCPGAHVEVILVFSPTVCFLGVDLKSAGMAAAAFMDWVTSLG